MADNHSSFEIEKERRQFTQLLAINPNHFGNLDSSPLAPASKMVCNTKYESIAGVAYNPDLDLLEVVVEIKLPSGYDSDTHAPGSREYLRFFVDYGCGWKDAGIASFVVHDEADKNDADLNSAPPRCYAVSLPHQPVRDRCDYPVVPNIRAILSWEVMPPADPDWRPVWGDILEKHVQVSPKARRLIELASDIAKTVKPGATLPEEFEYLRDSAYVVPAPPTRAIDKIAKLYRHDQTSFRVEPHRFAMPDIETMLATSFLFDAEAANAKFEQYGAIGLDWQAVVEALDRTVGNVDYEALTAVGFDPNRDWLVANLNIKRPVGYLGTLCESGSDEHIAFWVDWDGDGDWSYLAAVSVRVHDIATIPSGGLNYWVGVPIRSSEHRRSSKACKMGRVRAVLSWHVPPSSVDPDAVPNWGNRLDARIELKPHPFNEQATIDAIGGIGIADIDVDGDGMAVPYAVFAETGAPADPWVRDRRCAFGGDVVISAKVPADFSRKSYKYRILMRKAAGGGNGLPLMSSFVVNRSLARGGGSIWVAPELGSGWVDCLHPDQNIYSVLGSWRTANLGSAERDELWEVKLQLADASTNIISDTGWLRVQLDNRSPVAELQVDGKHRDNDCIEWSREVSINGRFLAYDSHGRFGAWALDTAPNNLLPKPAAATPYLSNSSATEAMLGQSWRLEMAAAVAETPLQASAYAYKVTLKVWDNTIVHSSQFLHNYAEDRVGLCLRAST